jgi:hypothetical protein
MNNNLPNTPRVTDLLSGNDKYISGLLIILANVIGFVSHFNKTNFSPITTYSILFVVIVLGSILARL